MTPSNPDNLAPILCAHLIGRVDERLIHLLNSLDPDEWNLPTVVPLWKVRDIAAHLLDTLARIQGNRALGERVLGLVAIVG